METNHQPSDYKTADLSQEALEKLKLLEGEIRSSVDKDVVLIAYENERK